MMATFQVHDERFTGKVTEKAFPSQVWTHINKMPPGMFIDIILDGPFMGLNEKCLGEGGTRALFTAHYMERGRFVYQGIPYKCVGDLLNLS